MQQPMTSPRDTVKDAPPAATPVAPESSARMRTGSTDPGLGPASTNPSPPPVEAEDPLATLDGPLPGYKVTAAQSDGLDAAAFHAAARNPPRSGYDTFDEKPSIIGPQMTPTPPPPAAVAPEPLIQRAGDTTQDSERKKRSKTTAFAVLGGIALLGVIAFVIKSASCGSDTQPTPSATTTISAAPTETTPPTATTSAAPIPTETIAPTATTTTSASVAPTATAKPSASAKPTATTPPTATTAPIPSTSASIDPLTHLLGSH